MNFKDWRKTAILLLAIPFSLVGGFWLLYLLDYNLSIAVWVGMIALAGLAVETGAVMLLYLDLAYEKAKAAGRMRHFAELKEAIHEGAVQRVRPKVMAAGTTMIGLMPILWAPTTEVGADVVKRIAAPMVGGLVTSFLLTLTIYPAIFALWKRVEMEGWSAVLAGPPSVSPARRLEPAALSTPWRAAAVVAAFVLAATLGLAWSNRPAAGDAPSGAVIHSVEQDGLEVSLRHPSGAFRPGANAFGIQVLDAATGRPIPASSVRWNCSCRPWERCRR